ncbi:MAG: FtsX-like permease family protein [Bacteroidota bacterium]
MNLPVKMAWRYLFAKKSTNAINIITLIAAFGVSIGTAALLLTMSVFNGFEDIFLGMFNSLNPDVKVEPIKGKTFTWTKEKAETLYTIPGIDLVSETLEETAIFTYRNKRGAGKIKGVDDAYVMINQIDTTIREGYYQMRDGTGKYYAVVGHQLANALGIDVVDPFETLNIIMAKRKRSRSIALSGGALPFVRKPVFPVGVMHTPQNVENQSVIIDIGLARDLLDLQERKISALEIRLYPGFDNQTTYDAISAVVGENFTVKNRLQQESGILKLMQIERWISFAVVALMMILISFNLIGALWMIVLEKKKDIAILQSMGLTPDQVSKIFLYVGLLLCGLGIVAGFVFATLLYMAQTQWALIRIPGLDAYPLSLRAVDFPVVAIVVLVIGLLASILPAQRAARIETIVREE